VCVAIMVLVSGLGHLLEPNAVCFVIARAIERTISVFSLASQATYVLRS
jgi:hypothetical protein